MLVMIYVLLRCYDFFLDTVIKRTPYLQFTASGQLTRNTKLVTRSQSAATLDLYRNSNTALNIIIVIAGVFVFITSVFVGTYVYKHCIKNTLLANNQGHDHFSKLKDGYNSLEMCTQESENQFSDPTYLEPVSNPRPHYDEVIDNSIGNNQQVSDVLSHSEIENKQLVDNLINFADSRNLVFLSDDKVTCQTRKQKPVLKTSSL